MSSVLGIITARGGSKGIPRKNIRFMCEEPLISYTIRAAKKSTLLSRCIVSTEDDEIAAIARQYGADVPFMRPIELAQDKSSSIDVVNHAISALERVGEAYEYVMILQPTSPLRTGKDIDNCIRKAYETGADSIMSLVEISDFALGKLKRLEDDKILPLLKDEGGQSSRRQDTPAVYKRNGAIFLTKTALLKKGDLFGEDSRAYIMPPERSVDINEPFDFDVASCLLAKQNICS